jgi:YhcH/YjgK/YiaL family protein
LSALGDDEVFGKRVAGCKDQRVVMGELKSWKSEPKLQRLEAAFRFLERADLKDLPEGRQEINGDKLFALVTKTVTRSAETAQFEAHRKYIDVHYIMEGQDTTGFAPTEELKVVEPYQEKADIEMFSVPSSYTKLRMYPGRYAVFLPGGGHMPNCHLNGPHSLHKIVVKVERDYGIR